MRGLHERMEPKGAEGTDLGLGGVDDDVNGDIGLPPHGRLVATSSDPARHPPHFAITHNLATQTNTNTHTHNNSTDWTKKLNTDNFTIHTQLVD